MEDRKKANATNDDINLQADTLTDLPVADEQAAATKGGTREGDGSNFLLADGHVKWFR
jgi:prepilin-type processing-associated H-X9-DG protein